MKTCCMKDTRHLVYSAGLYSTLLLLFQALVPVPMTYYMKDTRHLGYSVGLYSTLLHAFYR